MLLLIIRVEEIVLQSMGKYWPFIQKFLKVLWSYIVALARLVIWTIILFFSGLQRTLFTRSELIGVDMKLAPLRCDMEDVDEKLAYIDKLCIENPDLAEMAENAYLEDFEDGTDDTYDDDGGD